MSPALHSFSVTTPSLEGICTARGSNVLGRGGDWQQQRDGHSSKDVSFNSRSPGHREHNGSRRSSKRLSGRVAGADVAVLGGVSRRSTHRGEFYPGVRSEAHLEGTSIRRGEYERCRCGAKSQIFSQRRIRRASLPARYGMNLPNCRESGESLVEEGKKLAQLNHKIEFGKEGEEYRYISSRKVRRRRDYGGRSVRATRCSAEETVAGGVGSREGFFERLQSFSGWVERMEDLKWKFVSSAAAAGLSLALCSSSAMAAAADPISRTSDGGPMAQSPTMIIPATENVQPHMEGQLRHEFLAQIEMPKARLEEGIGQPQSLWTPNFGRVMRDLEERSEARLDDQEILNRVKLEMLDSHLVPTVNPNPAVMSPVATTVVGNGTPYEALEAGDVSVSAPTPTPTSSVSTPAPVAAASSSGGQTAGVRAREGSDIHPVAAVQAGSAVVAAAAAAGSRTLGSAASMAAVQVSTATTAATATVVPGVSFLTRIISHFGGGGVAGAMGATLVYPLDTIKTRMQAQTKKDGEEGGYKDDWDCFLQLVAKEGPSSLYSGLVPQLLGIAPEKAMKLTVNEVLMDMLESKMPGVGPWALELIAGGAGGLSQVVFTNPMEIVKVRLQTQSKDTKQKTSWDVVKELGVRGLYNGSAVTMARDIPSTAIFFAAYTFIRQFYPNQSFMAGFVAAIPATVLVTPFDVVKTRLQMEILPGEEAYKNAFTCFESILQKEGVGALFKGSVTRVLKTSPQFGLTLMLYNILSTGSPLDTVGSFLMQQGKFVLNMESKILHTFFP